MSLDLMLKVDKQFLDTSFYGVRQHMLACVRGSKPAKGHKTYPYLLGGLRIDRPNQVWCANIPSPW